MSLIDPATPECFFHLRLVPARELVLENRSPYFARHPETSRRSYFEEPLPELRRGRIGSDATLLEGSGVIRRVQALWASQGQAELAALAASLVTLQARLERDGQVDEDGYSDFVYTLYGRPLQYARQSKVSRVGGR